MGVSTNTEVIDFTGGMNTVKARHLISPTESLALVNVDIRNGSLRSMPELSRVSIALASHFVEFRDRPYFYEGFRTNAFMADNMYWANGKDTGKVLWDGRAMALGIDTPSVPLTLASVGNSPNGTHSGDFKYTYTFYSTETGVESAPAPLPSYLTVDQDDIVVDNFEPFPIDSEGVPLANRYRLYRIGGYLPMFTLVDTLDDTQTPYVDVLDDTEVDGRMLTTIRAGHPPAGLNDLVELNGRLFGTVGTKVYFSALGNPDAWYNADYFTMPDEIKALAKAPAGLLVLGQNFVYLLAGDGPQNFRMKLISNKLGCMARESIAYLQDNVIWLSTNGICSSNGYQISNLTADKISSIDNIKPTSATLINEVYYMHFMPTLVPDNELYPYERLYPLAAAGVRLLEEGVISMDFKRGNVYSYNLYTHKNTSSIGEYKGKPHAISADIDKIFLPCDEPLVCEDFMECTKYNFNVMSAYANTRLTRLLYISPQFIDGSLSTLKQYDKVRINLWGKFNLKVVFSDGSVVVEEDIDNRHRTLYTSLITTSAIDYSEDSTVIIGIPNNNNLSYSIGFILSGVGVVKSIQYSWKQREIP